MCLIITVLVYITIASRIRSVPGYTEVLSLG